jgi:hypothetical protein
MRCLSTIQIAKCETKKSGLGRKNPLKSDHLRPLVAPQPVPVSVSVPAPEIGWQSAVGREPLAGPTFNIRVIRKNVMSGLSGAGSQDRRQSSEAGAGIS